MQNLLIKLCSTLQKLNARNYKQCNRKRGAAVQHKTSLGEGSLSFLKCIVMHHEFLITTNIVLGHLHPFLIAYLFHMHPLHVTVQMISSGSTEGAFTAGIRSLPSMGAQMSHQIILRPEPVTATEGTSKHLTLWVLHISKLQQENQSNKTITIHKANR